MLYCHIAIIYKRMYTKIAYGSFESHYKYISGYDTNFSLSREGEGELIKKKYSQDLTIEWESNNLVRITNKAGTYSGMILHVYP